MSTGYRAVQWSPAKRRYDLTVVALLALYLAAFLAVTFAVRPEITAETALLRAFGTAALLLLHVVLAIGPLARLDRRFLPLLWNRRPRWRRSCSARSAGSSRSWSRSSG